VLRKFKFAHRGARKNWDLPNDFPNWRVVSAYTQVGNIVYSIEKLPSPSCQPTHCINTFLLHPTNPIPSRLCLLTPWPIAPHSGLPPWTPPPVGIVTVCKSGKEVPCTKLPCCLATLMWLDVTLQAKVDGSREAISFARPDLEHLRNFCTEKFGWAASKTDELMIPVLKVCLKKARLRNAPRNLHRWIVVPVPIMDVHSIKMDLSSSKLPMSSCCCELGKLEKYITC